MNLTPFQIVPKYRTPCLSSKQEVGAWERAFVPGKGWRGPISYHQAKSDTPADPASAYVGFARQRVAGLNVCSLAGYYWPARTVFLGKHEPNVSVALADAVNEQPPGPVLRLGPVVSSDEAVNLFTQQLRSRGWRMLRKELGPVLGLDLSHLQSDLGSFASASLLKNVMYCKRKLQREHGDLRIARHHLSRNCDELLPVLQKIESLSWVGEAGDAKFVGVENEFFWRSLSGVRNGAAEVIVWTMHVEDRPVAFSLHLESEATVAILANSYDQYFKTYSPGSILSRDIISDAIDRGVGTIDWGQGDSGYKERWGAQPIGCLQDLLLFAPSIIGRALQWPASRLGGWLPCL